MALLDQLRLLDRALRDVRVREALRTGDRGGRRLARFAGSVAPADLAVLRAVDARRFEAVAQRQAELIRDRWWTPRFPGILLGAAKALQGTTRDVALGALASAAYERREGADETGAALVGFVVGREDMSADPAWLKDLVAYEYLISVALPRRSKNESIDALLETKVFPEGTRFLQPPPKKAKASELVLARRVVVLPLEFPASQLREALLAGQEVADEIDSEPHVLVFLLEDDAADEHPLPARALDALDMIAAAPLEGQKLLEAFEPYDRVEVWEVLEQLFEAGVIAGARTARPEEVERPEEDEKPKGKKNKGKNKGAAKADAKGSKKPADEAADGSEATEAEAGSKAETASFAGAKAGGKTDKTKPAGKSAPAKSTPSKSAATKAGTTSAPEKAAPSKSASSRSAPTKSTPAKAASAPSSAKSASAKSAPAKPAPAKASSRSAPAKSPPKTSPKPAPAKSAPTKSPAAKAAPAKAAPAKAKAGVGAKKSPARRR